MEGIEEICLVCGEPITHLASDCHSVLHVYQTGKITESSVGSVYTSHRKRFLLGDTTIDRDFNNILKTSAYSVEQDILSKAELVEELETVANIEYENRVVNDGLIEMNKSIIEHKGCSASNQSYHRKKDRPKHLRNLPKYKIMHPRG